MDQILHRKLINEKNNLEFQVAKANKEIAKLMETVQQYEAVLASLNEADIERPDIPNKMRLRGDTKDTKEKPNLPRQSNRREVAPYKVVKRPSTGNRPIQEGFKDFMKDKEEVKEGMERISTPIREFYPASKKSQARWKDEDTRKIGETWKTKSGKFGAKNKDNLVSYSKDETKAKAWASSETKYKKMPYFQDDPYIDEATLVRGAEAIKLQAEKSGKRLPTAAEAKKKMEEIKANKELEQAGLGKLKKSRLDEVLDTMLDKKVAANVAKHSLKQVQDEKKMLGNMPEVTPARMTLLAQQAKNRESILKRLGEGKEGKQIGEYGSAKERADSANLARLQRKSGIDLGIRGTHREAGSHGGVTPAGEGAEQRRMAQQQKTIEKFN